MVLKLPTFFVADPVLPEPTICGPRATSTISMALPQPAAITDINARQMKIRIVPTCTYRNMTLRRGGPKASPAARNSHRYTARDACLTFAGYGHNHRQP